MDDNFTRSGSISGRVGSRTHGSGSVQFGTHDTVCSMSKWPKNILYLHVSIYREHLTFARQLKAMINLQL